MGYLFIHLACEAALKLLDWNHQIWTFMSNTFFLVEGETEYCLGGGVMG